MTDAQLLKFLNQIEYKVNTELFKKYIRQTITVTSDVLEYDLLEDYDETNIVDVYINKKRQTKKDIRELYGIYFGADVNVDNYGDIYTINKLICNTGINAELTLIYQIKKDSYTTSVLSYSNTYDRFNTFLILNENNLQLTLDYEKSNVYEEYIYAQIAKFNNDYNEYNNLVTIFNNSWDELKVWYKEREPQDPLTEPQDVRW